jgi:hypothetical protein
VVVFPVVEAELTEASATGGAGLPALPAGPGAWMPAGAGVWASGWRWVPAPGLF